MLKNFIRNSHSDCRLAYVCVRVIAYTQYGAPPYKLHHSASASPTSDVSCHVILSARYRRVLRTDIKVIPHQHSLLNKLGQDGCTRTVRGGAIAARFGRFGILYSGCKAYSACDAVFGMLYSDTSACCMRSDTSILRSVLRTSLSGAYMPGVLSRYGRNLGAQKRKKLRVAGAIAGASDAPPAVETENRIYHSIASSGNMTRLKGKGMAKP